MGVLSKLYVKKKQIKTVKLAEKIAVIKNFCMDNISDHY